MDEASTRPRVCVVGSVNMDLVVRAPRLPHAGETIIGGAYRTFPGGKGANQAVAAARMGSVVTFVGAVGDDPHGVKLRQTLESEGVNLEFLATRAGESTGLGLITVAESGENTIVVASGANTTVSTQQVQAARGAIEGCDVLLVQLEIPLASVATAVALAKGAGKAVVLNAAPARVLPAEIVKAVDAIIVNRSEAARLLSVEADTDPVRLQVRLPEIGPPAVVMTLGAQGSILSHRGRPRRFTSPSIHAVDSTGAGDAFCGAFAALWPRVARTPPRSAEELREVERVMEVASAAGALAASKAGAIPSLPRFDDVMALAGKAG